MSPTQDPLSSQSFAEAEGGRFAGWRNLPRRSRGLSLRTLVILRWMAIAGQSATIFVATAWFHFDLPLWGCLAVIAASVAMNLNATARLKRSDGSATDGTLTAAHLGFDILQLSLLLALTGGLQNPFCLLLVAPVTVAAASLPGRQAALMGLLVLLATVGMFFFSMPLPWQAGTELQLPTLYRFGIGLALITGVVFTAAYAWRVAADAEKLELALATTQDVLQREQRLAALGGLAAAAAHELGTPLATIQVVARELLREAAKGGAAAEDAALILSQAERCREILKRLSQQPEEGDAAFAEVDLKALLEEVVEPHRGFDLAFEVKVRTASGEAAPRVRRLPEVVHGLSTLVENAADFANGRVRVQAMVDAGFIEIEVVDDGPGFPADILPRLGEPYVTSRPQGKARRALAAQIAASVAAATPGRKGRKPARAAPAPEPEAIAPSQGGMGLGFFIARTLLERTGGKVAVGPGDGGRGRPRGARVAVRWPRPALEVPPS
ncbi:ActS/PrrB/RegB family redox-sensitive histidine kinase [Roseibacterium beibuensis]|uniref:ActS/PrrB/RegB family redox-sensitive histidine kinase n=1 Tax=[Roseibacterium] beibuensis TaxID=1193142 RepID=UPI00217E3A56|nr:ActS/PrrB/RegB family redox-sensitive histidine kinase [Roseibacterium beibuensis]MCS6626494.1 ActS/PrrB/RegB family redox-sensitive histidine kinase [Roseibacterium beibuensis]